jgi:hypothetical protein
MQAQELIKYINDPDLLEKESIPHLQKLVSDFPYFQSGHILLSLAAKKWDASVYQQSIKKTAIVVTNRAHLYELITAPEKVKEEPAIKPALEVPVATLNPVSEEPEKQTEKVFAQNAEVKPLISGEEQVEKEIEKALVSAIVEKEILKTHEARALNTSEPGSFGDWLQMLKKNNGQSYQDIEEKVKKDKEEKAKSLDQKQTEQLLKTKEKQKALIDKIIETNPGAIRHKEEQKFFKSDLKAKESLLENEHLITETLAQIYALQGNINKAIRAYEILSLKFPQKSVYFASLIQKLKNNQ